MNYPNDMHGKSYAAAREDAVAEQSRQAGVVFPGPPWRLTLGRLVYPDGRFAWRMRYLPIGADGSDVAEDGARFEVVEQLPLPDGTSFADPGAVCGRRS